MGINGHRFGEPAQVRVRGKIEPNTHAWFRGLHDCESSIRIEIRDADGARILSVPGRVALIDDEIGLLGLEAEVTVVLEPAPPDHEDDAERMRRLSNDERRGHLDIRNGLMALAALAGVAAEDLASITHLAPSVVEKIVRAEKRRAA